MRAWEKAAALRGDLLGSLLPVWLTPQRLPDLRASSGPAAPLVSIPLTAAVVVVKPKPSLPLKLAAGVTPRPLGRDR